MECKIGNTEHFTQDNITLLKSLAEAISIPNLHLEIEDGENEKDTLIIEYSEYVTYIPENETYITGHIVYFPGSRDEPPDDDYLDRKQYPTFANAAQDVVQYIATKKINQVLEFHWLSNLPSDPPQSPVGGLDEESTPSYGFTGVEA